MTRKTFMLTAGEPSGDLLAAELVSAIRERLPDAQFFGAGGPKMSAAGVELALDMTQHAVIGISDVLKNYFKFRRLFHQLLALAIERKPDAIIGVDYGGFNLRFGHAVKEHVRKNQTRPASMSWNPKIIQFVSPQVWASRPGRAKLLEADYDLLLSIFPFEKDWYAQRAPNLRVEFVGHPMLDRIQKPEFRSQNQSSVPKVLLLPGSRAGELQRHLPVMLPALKLIQAKSPDAKAKMVLPNGNLQRELILPLIQASNTVVRDLGDPHKMSEQMVELSLKDKLERFCRNCANLEIQIGNLTDALAQADMAIASTGTVTMECAFFGVPTVTLYKTSWMTYEIGKRIVTVKSLTMPNLLAGGEVYPEFIQGAATPENIANAALELLQNEPRRQKIKAQLEKIIASLGEPGATKRAAAAILSL